MPCQKMKIYIVSSQFQINLQQEMPNYFLKNIQFTNENFNALKCIFYVYLPKKRSTTMQFFESRWPPRLSHQALNHHEKKIMFFSWLSILFKSFQHFTPILLYIFLLSSRSLRSNDIISDRMQTFLIFKLARFWERKYTTSYLLKWVVQKKSNTI